MTETKAHWSRLGEAGTVLGMQVLLLSYRVLGRWGFRLLLWPVMAYYFVSRRDARRASAEYLLRFRECYPDAQLGRLASFRHFVAFGENLLDKFLAWMGHIQRQDVVFEDPEAFAELDRQQRGGVIIVSHLGNIEICRALAYQMPQARLTVLVYTRHAAKFNRLLNRVAAEGQIELLQVTEMSPATAMILAERVEAGEYVVIAGDRTPVSGQHRTSTVSFLGEPAPLAQGPLILASLLRCPVWLMFCLKVEGRYHIYLESFSERVVLPRSRRQEALDDLLQRYAGRLERYCRVAPLQWFNFFSFWAPPSQPPVTLRLSGSQETHE